jgi:hypothetical protein
VSERRPADLNELVGDGIPEAELAELRRVDALLRAVPAPPELPDSLSAPGRQESRALRLWTPRRSLAAVALAAVVAAVAFGLGAWTAGGNDFDERYSVAMSGTFEAPAASAVVRLGEPDDDGNRPIRLEATGLEPLPEGGYYVLWLEKDGEYAGTCGTFAVGADEAEAEWTVSYDFTDYDAWVVSARVPGDEPADAPRILEAEISF